MVRLPEHLRTADLPIHRLLHCTVHNSQLCSGSLALYLGATQGVHWQRPAGRNLESDNDRQNPSGVQILHLPLFLLLFLARLSLILPTESNIKNRNTIIFSDTLQFLEIIPALSHKITWRIEVEALFQLFILISAKWF